MMPTPALERAVAPTPGGALLRSGVDEFRSRLSAPDGFAEYAAWRSTPVTRAVANAILAMAVNPPPKCGDDALVQYGVTQGLVLARQLMLDPSSVMPGALDAVVPGAAEQVPARPVESFGTAVDEALDIL